MGFSKQEYWSGLPFPSLGDLLQGLNLGLPHCRQTLYHLSHQEIKLKAMSSKSYGFSRSHVQMWELDCKEGWAPKNWCFWTVALEKTLESPMDCKEIQPVHPKGDQSWIFIGRTYAEAEAPILQPPDMNSCPIRKDPDAGNDLKAGEGDDRGLGGWMSSLTQWTWVWTSSVKDREAWCAAVRGVMKSQTHLSNWTPTTKLTYFCKIAKLFVTTNMALRPLLGSYKEAHAQEKAWTEALMASWRICLFNLSMVSGILWSYFLGTETFSLFIHLTEMLGILVIYAGTKILWKSRQMKRTKWLKHAPLKKEPIIYL